MAKFPQPYYRSQRGTWCVQIDGKQITLGTDKEAAFREYHRLMALRDQPAAVTSPPAGPVYPLAVSVLEQYLEWLDKRVQEGTKAKRTYSWYQKYLHSFASFETPDYHIRDLTVAQLEPIHVYQWVDSHPGWTTGKRGAMTSVQRAFSWAAKAGVLKSLNGRSPLVALEKPQQGRREQLVTEEEYREVLTALSRREHLDLVELSWETGMRPHELFTAEARFFEEAAGRIVFPIRLSKGKKVQRVVYLNDRALEIVQRLARANPSGPMLRNTEGEPWKMFSVNCMFQRVRRELGRRRLQRLGVMPPKIPRLKTTQRGDQALRQQHNARVLGRRKEISRLAWEHGTKYSLYAMRHAFCTEALENGLDAVTVSVLMGHRDTTMISRVYAHVGQRHEHMRQAARRARGA